MPATRDNTSALIPAYFEGERIRGVTERVLKVLAHVLVVDDGSTDATADEASLGGAEVKRHEVNQGKGAAIKTGLRLLQETRPGLEYVMLLDGDGQHLPEEIPRFLQATAAGPSLVLGNRMSDLEKMPLVRKLTNRYMSWQISRLCGQPIPDTQCGFRLLPVALLPPLIASQADHYDFETEMLVAAARRGVRIASVTVSTVYGDEKSKIRPVRDTVRFFALLRRLRRQDHTPAAI